MHLKRITIPKTWPLPRKTSKFVVVQKPGRDKEKSVALGVLLRDILKEVKTLNEAKKSLIAGNLEINGKIVKEEKFPVGIFDRIFIKPLGKHYTLHLNKHGKLQIKEINQEKYPLKPVKVTGKTVLKGKKVQLNLDDGRNVLTDKKEIKVNDSVLINLKNKKIEKVLPLKKDARVFILGGKNVGNCGRLIEVNSKNALVEIESAKKKMLTKNLFVIEENEFK